MYTKGLCATINLYLGGMVMKLPFQKEKRSGF